MYQELYFASYMYSFMSSYRACAKFQFHSEEYPVRVYTYRRVNSIVSLCKDRIAIFLGNANPQPLKSHG